MPAFNNNSELTKPLGAVAIIAKPQGTTMILEDYRITVKGLTVIVINFDNPPLFVPSYFHKVILYG